MCTRGTQILRGTRPIDKPAAIVSEQRIASLCIERWELSAIKAHPKNPRTHPPKGSVKWEALRKSLDHDYFDPLVVNRRNGMLVSGHKRHPMMIDLGFIQADVSVVDYDEPTHYARMIAANTHLGEFEETMLSQLAGEIEAAGIDAALAGFDEKAFAALLEGPTVVDEPEPAEDLMSKADELQTRWQVKLGDVYQIGNHRLLCGDSASLDNWTLLLQGRLADMVWTDPPYNVAYDAIQRRRNDLNVERGRKPHVKPQTILNDDVTDAEYLQLLKSWFTAAHAVTKPGGAIYVAHADSHGAPTRNTLVEAGWYLAQCLIWVKNAATLGRQDYQWQHEPILYGWKSGAGHHWQGGYNQRTVIDAETDLSKLSKAELIVMVNQMRNERDTTVIREPRNAGNLLHPTVKPLQLVARQIWNSSRRGETVVELFGGSGTTLAACEQTGRHCVATELEPKYCAVILERLSAYGLNVDKVHGPQ